MINLFLRSTLVLALLFGLLFAVGVGAMLYLDAPLWFAIIFALVVISLQYIFGPWILQIIFKIEWREPETVDAELAAFIRRVCDERNIPLPRFGVIRDGNPNAFTFGHYPGDARLVVTTGLLDLLDSEERQAVVAHELGHIAHWDFVVLTIASAVPIVLYMIYVWGRRRARKGKGYIVAVAVLSYVAYVVSQLIVLLLSRVREYYADQFAGQVTENPNALSSALVKVAYGLAAAPQEKESDKRMVAGRAFGIFDPKAAQSLALASAGNSTVLSAESIEQAMKWDLWNPWAFIYELLSSHPLPAKRMRALERQSEAQGQPPRFSFHAHKPESYLDEFLVDVVVSYLPALAMLLAGAFSLLFLVQTPLRAAGFVILSGSVAWWLQRRFSYWHEFSQKRRVKSLVNEVKVSAVRSIPCTIEGKIIGRGIPGLFYGEDLVLQDDSGFIVVDYRQPLGILDFLFGLIKAESLIGQRGKIVGWYRRSPRPYFEMRRMTLESGETVTSYLYPVTQFIVYAGVLLGAVLLFV